MIEKVWGRQLTKKQSTQGKGSVALKRDVIDQIGINILFNKNISSGVDHYLGERIIERGYSIEFIENARTKSYLNHTIKGFITDQTRWNMGYFQQITRFEAAKILFFNMVLIFSLIILIASFFVHPYLASPFIFYSTYLFIQCAASSIYTSNLSLLIYFPIYLLLNLIDRTITIKSFLSNFFSQSKNNIHFKGERL
jgi:cellulose synthase/poly-beta-1,6-N-acetylglucosamine synthase-like glycosyltransferase